MGISKIRTSKKRTALMSACYTVNETNRYRMMKQIVDKADLDSGIILYQTLQDKSVMTL